MAWQMFSKKEKAAPARKPFRSSVTIGGLSVEVRENIVPGAQNNYDITIPPEDIGLKKLLTVKFREYFADSFTENENGFNFDLGQPANPNGGKILFAPDEMVKALNEMSLSFPDQTAIIIGAGVGELLAGLKEEAAVGEWLEYAMRYARIDTAQAANAAIAFYEREGALLDEMQQRILRDEIAHAYLRSRYRA